MTSPKPRRFAFITPSGWGNLGDAAIVESLIHAISQRVPGADVVGYTLHHLDTATRHGVSSGPLLSFSLPYYPVLGSDVEGPFELPRHDGSARVAVLRPSSLLGRIDTVARRRMWSVRAAEFAIGALRSHGEPRAIRSLREELADTEAIVVAGGGQLDARFGGVWGQPYVLLRWARIARSVGADFYVLSVGTGTLDAFERLVTRRALRLATYRSFRDERSRELIRSPRLTDSDAVVPDLAYGLSIEPKPLPASDRLTIGVSPMNYQHPDFYPAAVPARFERHVSGMHRVCRRLISLGHHVMLFTTDASDDVGLAAVVQRLEQDGDIRGDRWSVVGARTVDELMAMYQRTAAVVASRLHGALLAHVAHRPVLALAHERKVLTLLNEMGHGRYCFDLDQVNERELEKRLDELIDRREELAAEIAASVADRRSRVERQYDDVFGHRQ